MSVFKPYTAIVVDLRTLELTAFSGDLYDHIDDNHVVVTYGKNAVRAWNDAHAENTTCFIDRDGFLCLSKTKAKLYT